MGEAILSRTRGGELVPLPITDSTITIDSSKIDSNLTDYPVMVKLDSSNFDFTNILEANGYDVTFWDGTTQLDHEIELFDSVNEKAVFHVRIPSVSSTSNTTFTMKYGDASATDTSNATGVWDSIFVLVNHMGTNTNSAGGETGTITGAPLVDGLVGKARDFDGVDDHIAYSDHTDFDFGTGSFSIFALGKTNDNAKRNSIVSKRHSGETGLPSMIFRVYTDGKVNLDTYYSGASEVAGTTVLQEGVYYSMGCVRSSGGIHEIYVNGVLENSQTMTVRDVDNGQPLWIGDDNRDSAQIAQWDGVLDEVRISKTAISDAWIKADDYNLRQNNLITIS